MSPHRLTILLTVLLLLVLSAAAGAQDRSAALVKELTGLMETAKMTTVAAKDPGGTDRYTAAMFFPGSQLLVVTAKYEPAVLLDDKLAKKEYQDIYIDLNSAAVPNTRVFFEDLGADGLKPDREEGKAMDSVEMGGKRTIFDDEWRKDQKISEADWAKTFGDAEKVYVRLLEALVAQAKRR
ncbi:MAG: hypothetical protein AB1806_00360 [Acidobacteriota bacterium]